MNTNNPYVFPPKEDLRTTTPAPEAGTLFLQRRHGIVLSVNQLKNSLRFLGLKRRGISVSLGEVEDAIAVCN